MRQSQGIYPCMKLPSNVCLGNLDKTYITVKSSCYVRNGVLAVLYYCGHAFSIWKVAMYGAVDTNYIPEIPLNKQWIM